MADQKKASHYFSRYYEDYVTVEDTDQKGKPYRRKVYIGFYYEPKLEKKERRLHKAANIALLAVGVFLMIWSMTQRVPSNYYWFTTLPQAIGIFAVLYLTYLICLYTVREDILTIWGYRQTSVKLKTTAAFAAAFWALGGAEAIFCGFFYRKEGYLISEAICGIRLLLGALAMYAVYILERNVEYSKTQSDYIDEIRI